MYGWKEVKRLDLFGRCENFIFWKLWEMGDIMVFFIFLVVLLEVWLIWVNVGDVKNSLRCLICNF